MKFEQSKPHKRLRGAGFLLLIQNGHVFAGPKVYVGPEPEGSGSMHPLEVSRKAAELKGSEKKVEKKSEEKVEEKVEEKKIFKKALKKKKRY